MSKALHGQLQESVLSSPRADLRERGLEESSESSLQSPLLILLIYLF